MKIEVGGIPQIPEKRLCLPSWIDAYLEYTKNQESPRQFHLWTALSLLSATLGRNVSIPRVKYTIYPNIFVILVAGSGKCKKSTAIKLGERIIRNMNNAPIIFSQKVTPEALISALVSAKSQGTSSGIIVADELSVFMKTTKNDSGIISLLTTLFDSPDEWSYHTKQRGVETLKEVSLTILAGTTKVWLKTAVPPDAVAGGFAARVIFVYQDRPQRPILFHQESQHEKDLRVKLIDDLVYIRQRVNGEVKFSPDAIKYATEWYEEEFYKVRDEKMDGYFARKHDIMFKIAVLLSVSESDSLVVEKNHIIRALEVLEANELYMESILAGILSSPGGDAMEKILRIIKDNYDITHRELLRRCWRLADAQTMAMYIRTLVEGGEIEEFVTKDNRNRYYRVRR